MCNTVERRSCSFGGRGADRQCSVGWQSSSHEGTERPQVTVHQADPRRQRSPCEKRHDEALVGALIQRPLRSRPLHWHREGSISSQVQPYAYATCVSFFNTVMRGKIKCATRLADRQASHQSYWHVTSTQNHLGVSLSQKWASSCHSAQGNGSNLLQMWMARPLGMQE